MRGIHLNIYTRWGILSIMLDSRMSRPACTFPCVGWFHLEWFTHSPLVSERSEPEPGPDQ